MLEVSAWALLNIAAPISTVSAIRPIRTCLLLGVSMVVHFEHLAGAVQLEVKGLAAKLAEDRPARARRDGAIGGREISRAARSRVIAGHVPKEVRRRSARAELERYLDR